MEAGHAGPLANTAPGAGLASVPIPSTIQVQFYLRTVTQENVGRGPWRSIHAPLIGCLSMILMRRSRRTLARPSPPVMGNYGICSAFRSSAGSARTSSAGLPSCRGSSSLQRGRLSRRLETQDAGDSFFIIIDGMAAVRTPVGPGSQLQPGDCFGEMSLVDGEPRSATIVATTDLRVLVVDRSHFWRLLDETPELMRRILTILSRRVRRLEQTIRAILQGPNPT